MFSSSPRLIAAYHVFLRLPTPRHPPDALCNLSLEIAFLPFPVQLSMSQPVPRPAGLPPESHSRGGASSSCLLTDGSRARLLSASLVGLERLELSTSRLSGVRSNHLSYRPVSAWSFSFRRRQARRCLGHVCLNTLPASTARLPCRNKKSRRGKPLQSGGVAVSLPRSCMSGYTPVAASLRSLPETKIPARKPLSAASAHQGTYLVICPGTAPSGHMRPACIACA